MSAAEALRAWHDLLDAFEAFRWVLLELRGTTPGNVLIAAVVGSLGLSALGPLWAEKQRLSGSTNLRPLSSSLGALFGLLLAWAVALQFGRRLYLRALFDARDLDPSSRARDVAESMVIMVDASAVASVALLALSTSSLLILLRSDSIGPWSPVIASCLAAAATWSLGILVRTGSLFTPFVGCVGGESIDPSEKGRVLLQSYQRAQSALEAGRGLSLIHI